MGKRLVQVTGTHSAVARWRLTQVSACSLLLLLALALPPPSAWGDAKGQERALAAAANRQRYTALIQRAAKRHGVAAALLQAVIKVESNYDPAALSQAGAIGLMQLLPQTAADYGVESRETLFDPATNIDVGTRHLKRLLRKYKNISRALAAYHAGEGSVVAFRRTGPYIETRKYVVRVIKYYQKYKDR